MIIIGITGGIGTGKTTVCDILKTLGAKIIDADKLARDAVKKGENTLDELKSEFGNDILDDNGDLDRKKLADIVFKSKSADKLFILSEIVHKWIYEKMREEIEEYAEKNYNGVVIIDIPLPTQRFRKLFDELWVVDSNVGNRVQRVMKRNNCSEQDVQDRINNQMAQEEYIKLADKVILNDGTIEELKEKIEELYLTIKGDR